MNDVGRLFRVQQALGAAPAGNVVERLCWGAARVLDGPGVALAVATSEHELVTLGRTEVCGDADQLQSDLGEGPAWATHRSGWPVVVPDLANDDTWPAFGPAASGLGLRAVFAFPLRRGAARVGAITLYRWVAGELTGDEHADAVVVARVALDVVLASEATRSIDGLDDELFSAHGHDQPAVHQASGMVSVQLGIGVAAALSVLRAHAFASDRPLSEVAADVTARRLRMSDPPDP